MLNFFRFLGCFLFSSEALACSPLTGCVEEADVLLFWHGEGEHRYQSIATSTLTHARTHTHTYEAL